MMKNKCTIKNIIEVAISNLATVMAGIMVGFMLPKLLSIEGYGLYKTFTLYGTYVGLFSLGIIDGIVLTFGGKDYNELNRSKFRAYFHWYLIVHIIFGLILMFISLFGVKGEYKWIFFFLSIYLVSNNITGYFQQISQITQRYKEYSYRKILQASMNIVIVVVLLVISKQSSSVDYKLYLIMWIGVNVLLTLWYMKTYHSIVFGTSETLDNTRADLMGLIRQGFPLLFANLCSTLILTLDRQFVNILFPTLTYAIYAFAYNMLALVTVATSAISTVLYPMMKRTNKKNLENNYSSMISIMLLFVFATTSMFFPLSVFVLWFLPKYQESIIIFRVIFPGLAISSAVTVVMHNYYKVIGENLLYFKKSIIVLIVTGISNYLAYIIYRTTVSISIASVMTMIFWYIYIEQYFVDMYGYKRFKNLCYLIIMILVFYGISSMKNMWGSFFVYVTIYLIVTALFCKDKIREIVSSMNNR